MFKIVNKIEKLSNGTLYDGKYEVDDDSILMSSSFDGGTQIFFGELVRHIFMDVNTETNQCYGMVIILDAIKFKRHQYDLQECETIELISDCDKNELNIYRDLSLDYYVDLKNNLILIGNPYLKIKPICFFDDTYAVIQNGKLKLLIIKVNKDIIRKLKL